MNMNERPNPAWWPTEYCDEVMPPGRASPDAWIALGPDAPMLAPPEEGDDATRVLTDGAMVGFCSCITHDEIGLTLTADGHTFERAPPPGFEQCCILDGLQAETLASDIDAMIAALRETLEADEQPGEYFAAFYTYDQGADYRFVAASRTFEKVEAPVRETEDGK